MIDWEPKKDRHIRGKTLAGFAWIRLDDQDRVLGAYLILKGSEKEKWVPRREEDETIAEAMRWAEHRVLLIELAKN
jgi:hypothetical protein